jgi:16S rRNA (cytosine967-C5)-methyltransferase
MTPRAGRSTEQPAARALALHTLLTLEQRGGFADDLLHAMLDREVPSRERALTVELVYGVLRHRSFLDWRLQHVADRPLHRLPVLVLTALRLGAYQLLLLTKIPPSAAVNESVALIKSGRPVRSSSTRDWTGFVNAILRALTRQPPPAPPDPHADPVAAYAVLYSCPTWLTRRWVERFGAEHAESICRATTAIPPLTIRANTLRVTRDVLAERLRQSGHAVGPALVSPVGLTLEKTGPVGHLPEFREGLFYVEDEAGQLIAPLLAPRPGERVLDLCAAPGGKATHLAALMQNRGTLVAVDSSPSRLGLLADNVRRLGIGIVTPVAADATTEATKVSAHLKEPFDRVLVDAPCSGLGVLRRHPEGKWQKGAEQLDQHRRRQRRILEQAGRLLRPGGVLVYSTCSTEPEENEQVIDEFCSTHADFHREPAAPWLPDAARGYVTDQGHFSTVYNRHDMDMFFAVRLRKAAS